MKYTVDLNDRPVYLQIYRQLRADIVGGAFAYGSKLPSKRLLAEELGVSTITTEHAYNLLCEEGYVQARERSGYFVVFRRSDGFAASDSRPPEPMRGKISNTASPNFHYRCSAGRCAKLLRTAEKRYLNAHLTRDALNCATHCGNISRETAAYRLTRSR